MLAFDRSVSLNLLLKPEELEKYERRDQRELRCKTI